MSTLRYSAFFVLFVLTLCGLALGQTQITTGVIQGTVFDQSGAVMPGAGVAARNLSTQVETTQKTDGDGRFVFLALSPGPYSVTASKAGFSKLVQKDVELTVGQSL
ncbi:MAG TPA: carboxypeptidase-like regulatory domain-containing protein, partial [Candidatus Sulfotelmatobacter sp.]|nr:carboxypeptidase-like regulatory domain-containing protein [Candidatus Sulfotelmatobacter sp.]